MGKDLNRNLHKLLTILMVVGILTSSLMLVATTTSTKAAGENWLDGWAYRKSQEISPSSGAGTDYPILFHLYFGSGTDTTETYLGIPASKIYLNSHAQADFDDIRFTNDDGSTLLDYCIENYTASTQATVWVEVADDLSTSTQTIYLYYGNATATSDSDGAATFLLYDDFSDGSLDTSIWATSGTFTTTSFSDGIITLGKSTSGWAFVYSKTQFGPNTQHRSLLKLYNSAPGANIGTSWGYNSTNDWLCFAGTSGYLTRFAGTSVTQTYDTNYHIYSSKYVVNSITFQRDGTNAGSQPQTATCSDSKAVHMGVCQLSTGISCDWYMVRKVIASEPSHSTIGEESTSLEPIITSTPETDGMENQTYEYQATCNLPVTQWSMSGGDFLSINSTGFISGSPEVGDAGTYAIVLSATTAGGTAWGNYSLEIVSAPKYADWYDENWLYRKSHAIEDVASITYSGYQIPIVIYYGTGYDGSTTLGDMEAGAVYLNELCRFDFSDVRFIDSNNIDRLAFWIEVQTDGDSAICWVRLNGSLSTSTQTIYLYYGNANATVSASCGELTFPDFFEDFSPNGGTWTKKGLVIETNGGATSSTLGFWEPTVLYEDHAQVLDVDDDIEVFKIWYRHMVVGSPNVNSIYYAESLDGYNWTHYASNPVVGPGVAYPNVYKIDGTYYMSVSKYAVTTNYDIYTSSNGISWTLAKSDALVSGGSGDWDNLLGNMFIWKEGTNSWYMTYEATISGSVCWNVGLATSTDGLTWTKYESNPVIGSSSYDVGNPQVFKFGSTYYMAYHGCAAAGLPTDFGWAYSTDLHSWTVIGTTMVRTWEGTGSSAQIGDPSYIEGLGMTWVYYAANPDQSHFYGIGVAISGLTIEQLVQTRQNMTNSMTRLMDSNGGTNSMSNGIVSTYGGVSTWSNLQTIDSISTIDTAMRIRADTSGSVSGTNTGYQIAVNLTASNTNRIDYLHANTGTTVSLLRNTADGSSWTQTSSSWDTGAYETLEIGRNSSSIAFRKDNTLLIPLITENVPSGDLRVLLSSIGGSSYTLSVDWLLVREYSVTEPDQSTWGTLQCLGDFTPWYVIISTPITTGTVGEEYTYQALCNGTVSSWHISGASFLTINTTTGLISGTPDSGDVGSHSIVLYAVTDANTAYGNYTLNISNAPSYYYVFTSTPVTTGSEGESYSYQALCNGTVSSWNISGADFLSISATGLVNGTPGLWTAGTYTISITATIELWGQIYQNYSLAISMAATYEFTSTPDPTEYEGLEYTYQGEIDGTATGWGMSTNATFLSINVTTGLVTGTVPEAMLGSYYVHLWANTSTYTAYHNYTLVSLDLVWDSVTITASTNGLSVTFSYHVDSGPPVEAITATYWEFGDGRTSNATSVICTYPAAGTYTVNVTVTNILGENVTGTKNVTVLASSTAPSTSPPKVLPSGGSGGGGGGDTEGTSGSGRLFIILIPVVLILLALLLMMGRSNLGRRRT